jgi:hypothetical protein
MNEYENTRRVCFNCGDSIGTAQFIPVCEVCGRFVKATTIKVNEVVGLFDEPNAVCKKCGPTHMLFEGFF